MEEVLIIVCSLSKGECDHLSTVYSRLGCVYMDLGNYAKAVENFEAAIREKEKNTDLINYAILMENLAECYYEMKKYKQALKIFEESMPLDHRYITETRAFLTEIEKQLGGDVK